MSKDILKEGVTGPQRDVFNHLFLFEERRVNATIISCPHSDPWDTEFIIKNLRQIGTTNEKVLFVEQGSPNQTDHFAYQLTEIANNNPRIEEDLQKSLKGYGVGGRHSRLSILNPKSPYSNSPFAIAADFWLQNSGKVVNMDCDMNLSPDALLFIENTLSKDLVLEHLYTHLANLCASPKDIIPLMMKLLFPELSTSYIAKQCNRLYRLYAENLAW